jgi:PAS domain S-box-containing protein
MGNLVIAWGLFRYRLFDIVPIAYDLIVESMSDAVMVLDVHDRVVDVNGAMKSVLGTKDMTGDMIGQDARDVFANWETMAAHLQASDQDADIDLTLNRPTAPRYYHLRLSPLHDQQGEYLGRVIVMRDMTERRQAEEKIRKHSTELEVMNDLLSDANRQLKVLSSAKDEFVANFSHELRTPITNQMLYLQMLKRHPERQETYIPILERETQRLEAMIDGLLTLSRFDQGRPPLHQEKVDLNRIVAAYVADRGELAKSKGLDLTQATTPELPQIYADQALISQVLSILLTNALAYTSSGGRVRVATHVAETDRRPWVGFSVRDTGPGILPEDQERLFTRFFRGQAGRASETPGTGLGLAIAREIVRLHQGRIEVESQGIPGEGATFSVWLPVD